MWGNVDAVQYVHFQIGKFKVKIQQVRIVKFRTDLHSVRRIDYPSAVGSQENNPIDFYLTLFNNAAGIYE